MVVAVILAFITVSIFASYFGLTLLKKVIDEVGLTAIITFLIIALAIIFKPVTEDILMTFWGFTKSVLMFLKALIFGR